MLNLTLTRKSRHPSILDALLVKLPPNGDENKQEDLYLSPLAIRRSYVSLKDRIREREHQRKYQHR